MVSETIKVQHRLLEQYSTTISIFKDIKARYSTLRQPNALIKPEDIAILTERMLPIIARPTDIDPKSLTNQVMYAASRIPKEIFLHDADVQIRFNDDPEFFLKHTSAEGVGDAKTAPDRKRLYVVEEIVGADGVKKRLITVHAQSQTAVIETMIHASVIEQLREYLSKLIRHKFPAHDVHLFERRTRQIKKLLTLFVDDPQTADNELHEWLNRKIEFVGNEDLPHWEDLKYKSKTAQRLASDTRKSLEGKNLPRGILFSNNYSLTNILSHHMLNRRIAGGIRRNVIIKKAIDAWAVYENNHNQSANDPPPSKNPLEALGESLSKFKDLDISNIESDPGTMFKIDNLIMFYITRKNGNGSGFHDETVDDFLEAFNSTNRLSDLGVTRLVSPGNSPTAEPIYFIDFSLISDEIISGLNPLIREAISSLKKHHFSSIYMSYAPGDLTFSIISEMKKAIPSIDSVMEVGKVAHYIGGFTQRKFSDIGHVVLPKFTFDVTHPDAPTSYNNNVELGDLEKFEPKNSIYETALIQLPSVILQEADDIETYLVRTFGDRLEKEHFTINMEASSFREAIGRSHGDLRFFEADYISDHAISSKTIDIYHAKGKEKAFQQITKKLEEEGVQGVHAATAAVILALSK